MSNSRGLLGRRVRVPSRLGDLTTTGPETPARDLGLPALAVPTIWSAAQVLYRTGLHPGLSLVVRHRGETVLNRAIGTRRWPDGGGSPAYADRMTPDTPACLYSCSKAITALVVHKLVEQGSLDLDEPVIAHLPEFAAQGKESITLRQLLSHRAGLAALPLPKNPDPMLLLDRELMVRLLCEAPQSDRVRQAYHAVTAGYILGEVAERATGRSLPDLLDHCVTAPLGLTTMTYGVPQDRRDEVALSYSTGPDQLPPLTQVVHRLLGIRPHVIAPALNTPEAMDAVVPAANVHASAADLATLFQMLLDGGSWEGSRVFERETIEEATRPAGPLVIDGSIPVPLRFSAGFMLGERGPNLFGVLSPRAFGHLGFTNILGWADPDRDLAVGLVTTGKAVSPEGVLAMAGLTAAITTAIPPRNRRPAHRP